MSEKSLLSIYLAVAHLHLSPLFEEKLMTLWLGANSKQQTPNLLELKVSLGQNQDAELSRRAPCSTNKNILN